MAASFADSFELLRQIGAGGFGAVYEARDKLGGGIVAVKVLHTVDALAERRFEREVSLLSRLQHPNIVRYLGQGRTDENRAYLIMEWLDGHTLETMLKRGPLLVHDALCLARCVVAGLEQAQRLGIVHRDLKPGNLFLVLGSAAQTKVLDFGLARRLEDADALTRTGVAIGTPHYMSPEQARGERQLGFATDVFALGSVLYECLTGLRPFDTGHILATLMMICVEEPTRIEALRPDVPPMLARLVHAMLAKVPAERPTLAVIASELAHLIARPGEDNAADTRQLVLRAEPAARALTPRGEQRVLSALFIDHAGPSRAVLEATLKTLLPRFGARGERLLDGTRILMLDSYPTAGEQAVAAARLALELRATVGVPMALCTGRALVDRRLPLGDLIERGVRLLGDVGGEDILLDEASAALLDARFETRGAEGSRTLMRERLGGEAPRTLLGQVTPFVGRDRELIRLEGLCLESIDDGAARVGLVIGNAGAGKSRLRYELVRRLQLAAPSLALLSAHGDSMRVGTPFFVLTSALCGWAELRNADGHAIKQHKLSTCVRRLLPSDRADIVAPFLGEMIGVPFVDEGSPGLRAARRDPRLMADRLLSSFLEWLEALSAHGPLAFLIEDLHWADPASVRFLDAALGTLSERPFVVLAFARPEVRGSFPALWSERGLFEMHLPKLGAQACKRVLQAIGTADLSELTQQWLVDRAEGNPFFLEELVRGLRGHTADRESLPDTIVGVVQTRLDALGEGAKWLVRAASVFGQVFRADALEALFGEHAQHFDLAGWLRLLIEREVVFVRGEPEAREYVFRHALIRDAAYALLTPEERTLGHRLAAEWLEQRELSEPALLAEHFEIGEVHDRAAFWYCAAAAAALEASSLPDVVRCGERAVRCGAGGEPLGDVASLVAEAVSYAGDDVEGERWATIARRHSGSDHTAWWRASQVLTVAHVRQGTRDQAEHVIDEMLARAEDHPLTSEVVIALSVVAQAATVGQLGEYGPRILTLLGGATSDELGGRPRGHLHSARAAAALGSSPEQALSEQRLALVAFRQDGCLRDVAQVLGNLGWFLVDAGLLDDAEDCLHETIRLGDRLGLPADVANGRQNLALVCLARGQTELAEKEQREAASIYARLQVPREEARSLAYLARTVAERGDLDEAATLIARSLALGGFDPATHAVTLAICAEIDRRRGLSDASLRSAQAAMHLHKEHDLVEHVALIWVALIEAHLACRQTEQARETLSGAYAWLSERALRFGDSTLRRAFLTQVPDNAHIMTLVARWMTTTA